MYPLGFFFLNKLRKEEMYKVRDCIPKPNLLNLTNFYSETYWSSFYFAFPFMKRFVN